MKRNYTTVIVIACFLALILWGILADAAQKHPLAVWLSIGLIVAIFIASLVLFKAVRDRVWQWTNSLARNAWDSLTRASVEEKERRSERSYIRRDIRQQVVKRANGRCENPDCRFPRQLEFHHIDKVNTHNAPNNLALLCRRCHTDSHAKVAGYRKEQIRLWVSNNYRRMKLAS